MTLKKLPRLVAKSKKRLGRGHGSGRGKTAGRGTKGQNARKRLSITHSHYEGGQRSLIKRLPYRRGKGNSISSPKQIAINLVTLNNLPKNSIVDFDLLTKYKLIKSDQALKYGVKILGMGEISIPVTIKLPISKQAAAKIEKAGGKIESEKH